MIAVLRTSFFFLLTTIPVIGFSQFTDQNFRKLSIGPSFEPLIAYRQLNYSGVNKPVATLRNQRETAKLGFVAAINLRQRLSRKASIEYGLSYASYGYNTKAVSLDFVSSDVEVPLKSKTSFTFQRIGIPIKFNYSFQIGNLQSYVTSGISTNYIIHKQSKITSFLTNDNSKTHIDNASTGLQNVNFSLMMGIGFNYLIFDRITVSIEPQIRTSLTSITTDLNAKEHPYSFGTNLRLFYNFKK